MKIEPGRRSRGLPTLACLVLLLALPLTSPPRAQTEPAPAPAGTDETDEAGEPGPPRADLSPVNELIRESLWAEAETLLSGLAEEFPDDPALLLMRGEVLLALGRAPDALEPLRRSAELDPARPRVNFQLGTARSITGDTAGALEAFAAEIASNDDADVQALALLNRSMLFQQSRRWSDAAGELERLVAQQPERVEAFGDLATLYLQTGDTAAATDALTRGEAAGFRSGEHHYSLGARLYRDKEYDQAVAAFERALEIEPELAKAERSLGAAFDRLDRREDAVEHLQRYLELAPAAPDAERVAEQIRAAGGG